MSGKNDTLHLDGLVVAKDLDGITMFFSKDPPQHETDTHHLVKASVSIVETGEYWTETGICDMAFRNCRELVGIEIPDADFIGSAAFFGCDSLEELHIPASIRTIDYGITAGCAGLKTISVDPDNSHYCSPPGSNCIVSKHHACFYYKKELLAKGKELISVCRGSVIPDVAIIGQSVFTGIPFADADGTIILPDSVRAVRRYAFFDCPNLQKVIGRGVIIASESCARKGTVLEFSKDCRFID